MEEVAYHLFDGAAGIGPTPDRLLQVSNGQQLLQQEQQQQQQQQQFPQGVPAQEQLYAPKEWADGDSNRMSFDTEQYYNEQKFYNEVLSNLHGFGGASEGRINGATDVGVSDAMASFGFNSILFVFLMLCYELVSRMMPSLYACRKLHVSDDRKVIDIPTTCLPFSWVPTVFRTSWTTVRNCGGLDSYFFLRFIRLCFRITLVSGLWGMFVLWPVFATGQGGATGWDYFSMANVSNSSWRLWFPTVFMVLLTTYTLFVINEELMHYLELRMEYLAGGVYEDLDAQAQYSLTVEELPRDLRSDKALYAYFDSLFPGQVHNASVVLNVPQLDKISAKRKRTLRRLEKSMAYFEATAARPTHIVGTKRCMVCGIETFPLRSFGGKLVEEDEMKSPQRGERVDSVIYYSNMLNRLNEKIEGMQKEASDAVAASNTNLEKATEWIANVITKTTDVATSSLSSNNNDNSFLGIRKTRSVHGFFSQVFIDFLFGGLALMNRNINTVMETMKGTRMSSTGFVTFKSLTTASTASRVPLSHDPDVIITSVAPDPREIIWENAHVNLSYSKGREFTANICAGLGALLWSTVVASIQTWANLEHLVEVPGFSWVQSFKGGQFTTFVNGYLPVVALLSIIGILPKIFESIAMKFESRKTKTDVQRSILGRYFYYQLANIYITVTAGSIWTAFSAIVDHPGAVFEILGRSLPTMVGFFVSLLMTKTLAGLPIIMLRPPSLLRRIFVKICFRQKFLTQREIDEVYKKETLDIGVEYPTQLLVIVICFTYACISPIILPVGSIYFLCALIVYKKQILVFYTAEYEGGGVMFPAACQRALIGLTMSQVTLIGYTILRGGLYQPLLLLPLPFLTYKMMGTFDRVYTQPSLLLSLDRATQLDKQSMAKIHFNEGLYRQPVLTETRAEPLPYRVAKSHGTTVALAGQSERLGIFNDDTDKIV